MGLWDKIKSWLGINKVKALPEGQENQRSPYETAVTLRRSDGTVFMLQPRLDKVGNQLYKPVLNHNTGEMQYIPEYTISDENLKYTQTNRGSTISSVCMDIDMEMLRDETYNYYIADVLLGSQRLGEVIDENMHYAGGLSIGECGQILGHYSDEGIVEGLRASARENNQIYNEQQSQKDAENMEEIRQNAAKITPSIEKNGEGILTPDMDPYR